MAGKSPTAPDAPHGTRARYQLHLRRGEVPCDLCNEANNEATNHWRRNHASAEMAAGRALTAQRRAVLAEAVGDGSYGGIAGGS